MIIDYAKKPEGSFAAFSAKIMVTPDTLNEWARVHKEFSVAKAMAKKLNEKAMVDIGLRGAQGQLPMGAWQNAWSFMMKARHGWREEGPDGQDDADLEFEEG